MRKIFLAISTILLIGFFLFTLNIFLTYETADTCAKKAKACKAGLKKYSHKSKFLFGLGKCEVICVEDEKN